MAFIFGAPGLPKSQAELQRLRKRAQELDPGGRMPRNIGEGLSYLGQSIAAAMLDRKASAAEDATASWNSERQRPLYEALMQPTPDPYASAMPSLAGGADAPAQAARLPNEVGGPDERAPQTNLVAGIKETATALGIDPVDLATVISYETAGTMDPTKAGPRTQWGQHKGLIQFGEPQAKQYGVDWANPVGSQLGTDGAVAKYLRDAGVQPGMGLLDVYSAVNAGRVGRYNASDANNGGAPGTVRDKVEQQMGGHREKALALLGTPPQSDAMSAVNAMAEQPSPIAARVTQALMPQGSPAPAGNPMPNALGPKGPTYSPFADPASSQFIQPPPAGSNRSPSAIQSYIIDALTNPQSDEQTRAVASMLMQRQLSAQQPGEAFTLGEGQIRFDGRGRPIASGPQKAADTAKPTDDMREYELAKQQGFQGSFFDYQRQMKEAGRSTMTMTTANETEFEKGIGKTQAEMFTGLSSDGMVAQSDLAKITELRTRLASNPGGILTGLQQYASSLGIKLGDNVSDIEAASAIINSLVPTQRPAGSGTMSDRDVQLFKESLPGLMNTPAGNALILDTMQAMAEYRLRQSDIANAVLTKQMDRNEGLRALRSLPNPIDAFRAKAGLGRTPPAGAPEGTPGKVRRYNPATGQIEDVN
jgi:hypothetical protein